MKLRNIIFAAILALPATGALAQGAMPDLKTFASSAEVQALLDKAKAMPPKPTISQNIVFVAPYRVNLEFRTEAFNVSNTPPLNDPNGSFGSAAFGSITSAGNPRDFEFTGKVRF